MAEMKMDLFAKIETKQKKGKKEDENKLKFF
jgi:hypothetical protein